MAHSHSYSTGVRIALTVCLSIALFGAAPALKISAASSVSQAQAAAQQAAANAAKVATQLQTTELALKSANADLTTLVQQIPALNATITTDQHTYNSISASLKQQKAYLSEVMKSTYEAGSEASFIYLVSSPNFSQAVDREISVDNVLAMNHTLVSSIGSEQKQASAALATAQAAKSALTAKEEQAQTTEVLLQSDEEQLHQETTAANAQAQNAQNQLDVAQQEAAAAAAENSLKKADPTPTPTPSPKPSPPPTYSSGGNLLFLPLDGTTNPFTTLTNLTLPSGENAATLNAYLQGTDLAGLGQYFMLAEQTSGVSARYLLAHAIEESGWGTSALAQQKYNLFGYDAYDANPYGDGMTFNSDADCIAYVAQQVSQNYLNANGQYYHGPTLLGMNVDYATDPNWANNIAEIAATIPLPTPPPTS